MIINYGIWLKISHLNTKIYMWYIQGDQYSAKQKRLDLIEYNLLRILMQSTYLRLHVRYSIKVLDLSVTLTIENPNSKN